VDEKGGMTKLGILNGRHAAAEVKLNFTVPALWEVAIYCIESYWLLRCMVHRHVGKLKQNLRDRGEGKR
jgi:hypothetical protein